jgi:hypothetical protein
MNWDQIAAKWAPTSRSSYKIVTDSEAESQSTVRWC